MPTKKQSHKGGAKPTGAISSASSVSFEDLEKLDGLAERIKDMRIKRGFQTPADFCQHSGVTKQYLGNIEGGISKRPEALPILKIARGLQVTVEWLLTGEGDPSGGTKDILNPDEALLLQAVRNAKQHDMVIVQHILGPYYRRRKPAK